MLIQSNFALSSVIHSIFHILYLLHQLNKNKNISKFLKLFSNNTYFVLPNKKIVKHGLLWDKNKKLHEKSSKMGLKDASIAQLHLNRFNVLDIRIVRPLVLKNPRTVRFLSDARFWVLKQNGGTFKNWPKISKSKMQICRQLFTPRINLEVSAL